MDALDSIEVTHTDEGHSGFQLTFQIGRSGKKDLVDYELLIAPLLQPCNRVVLTVTMGGLPRVLMDGVITNQQMAPGDAPGASTLTVTGEDVSVVMGMEDASVEHTAQPDAAIVAKIIGSYALYGMIPAVIPPPSIDVPSPTDRIPVQQESDLAYVQRLASHSGYVFYVIPGPAPLTNTAYWGPPIRVSIRQRALSVNLGPDTNVDSINFQYNALQPKAVEGRIQDGFTGRSWPVRFSSTLRQPLSSLPALVTQRRIRKVRYRAEGGLKMPQALARAQGMVDASTDVVSASGEIDALRYGDLLMPRLLVDLRGAGFLNDGTYYVKSVTHSIRSGEYKQRFSLAREGLGALLPKVHV